MDLNLLCAAEQDLCASVNGADFSANLNLFAYILLQIADGGAVAVEADKGKVAVAGGGVGRADVEDASAVVEVDLLIDVGFDANFLMQAVGDGGRRVAALGGLCR